MLLFFGAIREVCETQNRWIFKVLIWSGEKILIGKDPKGLQKGYLWKNGTLILTSKWTHKESEIVIMFYFVDFRRILLHCQIPFPEICWSGDPHTLSESFFTVHI